MTKAIELALAGHSYDDIAKHRLLEQGHGHGLEGHPGQPH